MQILLLLFFFPMVFNIFPADITNCNNEKVQTEDFAFKEWDQLAICCRLKKDLCTTAKDEDSLTLLPVNEMGTCQNSCHIYLQRLDTCSVKFKVENVTSSYSGHYLCKLNKSEINKQQLHIYEKPTPSIKSIVCKQDKVCNITFDKGEYAENYTDTVTVRLIRKSVKEFQYYTQDNSCNERLCHCSVTFHEGLYLNVLWDMSIELNVTRGAHHVTTTKSVKLAAYVLPDPVETLTVNVAPNTTNEATIQFCMNQAALNLYRYMENDGAPLRHYVRVEALEGVPQVLQMTINATSQKEDIQCQNVDLVRLTAFTWYRATVIENGGGGNSSSTHLQFRTNPTVPAHPPMVKEFGFMNREESMPPLVLMWKPLQHSAVRGENLTYHIEVTSSDGFKWSYTTPRIFATIKDPPRTLLTAKIWAQNAVGRTVYHSLISIPPITDLSLPTVIVEYYKNSMMVILTFSNDKIDSSVQIHWCSNYTRESGSSPLCQEYPKTIYLNNSLSETKINKTISMNNTFKFNSKRKSMKINYWDLFDSTSKPLANRSVMCDMVKCQSLLLTPGLENKNVDDNLIDDIYKSKDDIDSCCSSIAAHQSLKHGQQSPANVSTKVFVSMSRSEKEGNTGMFPAKCYFDSGKEKVELIMSLELKGTERFFRWSQTCESDRPSQFLAKTFVIYSAQNEHCNGKKFVIQQPNDMPQPNRMKLSPEMDPFLCVQACRQDVTNPCDSHLHVFSVSDNLAAAEVDKIFVAVVIGILVAVALLIACFLCIRKCKRSKGQGKMLSGIKITPQEKKTEKEPAKSNSVKVHAVPTLTDIKRVSYYTDSGKGSLLSNSSFWTEYQSGGDSQLTKSNQEKSISKQTSTVRGDKQAENRSCDSNDQSDSTAQVQRFQESELIFQADTMSGNSCSGGSSEENSLLGRSDPWAGSRQEAEESMDSTVSSCVDKVPPIKATITTASGKQRGINQMHESHLGNNSSCSNLCNSSVNTANDSSESDAHDYSKFRERGLIFIKDESLLSDKSSSSSAGTGELNICSQTWTPSINHQSSSNIMTGFKAGSVSPLVNSSSSYPCDILINHNNNIRKNNSDKSTDSISGQPGSLAREGFASAYNGDSSQSDSSEGPSPRVQKSKFKPEACDLPGKHELISLLPSWQNGSVATHLTAKALRKNQESNGDSHPQMNQINTAESCCDDYELEECFSSTGYTSDGDSGQNKVLLKRGLHF